MYAMLGTHPDITYAIGMLSQYSANPSSDHVNVVNCLLWYLNMMKDFKIIYDGSSCEDDHSAYSDSDWAGDSHDHWSISGYVFKIAGAAVSWSSKKQSTMALSSTKGEYIVLEISA